MQELLQELAALRRRIRRARAVDAALRWGFHASVAGCGALLLSKLCGIGFSLALGASVLALVPLAMAAREWTRAFSLRDCAIHLDRLLGLEERLATALEEPGKMGPRVVADASGALLRSPLPPRRLPREGKLLVASAVLLLVLGSIPSPGRSGARLDPAIESLGAREAAKLESLAGVDVEFQEETREAARELRNGDPERALGLLEDLKRKLAERFLEGSGGSSPATGPLLDQASSSAAALSAELARLGRVVHAPPPVVAQAKLSRQRIPAPDVFPAELEPGSPGSTRVAQAQKIPLNPRYERIVLTYLNHFGREP